MIVAIPSSVTVRNARACRDIVLDGIASEGAIEIDIATVEEGDLSLLQLLAALRATAAFAGRPVRLRSPAPAPVAALLERAGFLAAASPDDLDFWFHGECPQ
ncbi:STAS domain-containing protein [Sphingomonas sp. CJ20]